MGNERKRKAYYKINYQEKKKLKLLASQAAPSSAAPPSPAEPSPSGPLAPAAVSSPSSSTAPSPSSAPALSTRRTPLKRLRSWSSFAAAVTPAIAAASSLRPALPSHPDFIKIVRGSTDQRYVSDYLDAGAGAQCTAMAVAAAVHMHAQPDASAWDVHFVNKILVDGDNLYRVSAIKTGQPLGTYLMLVHVESNVSIHAGQFRVIYDDDDFYGPLISELPLEGPWLHLREGLAAAFDREQFVVFTARDMTFLLFKNRESGHIYFFDSHSRDENGLPHGEGVACVIEFADSCAVIRHLLRLYYGSTSPVSNTNAEQYTATPIRVVRVAAPNDDNLVSLPSADPRRIPFIAEIMEITKATANKQLCSPPSKKRASVGVRTRSATKNIAGPRTITKEKCTRSSSMYLEMSSVIPSTTNKYAARVKNVGDLKTLAQHYCGPMNVACEKCGALKFRDETLTCCGGGRIDLPLLPPPPNFIGNLLKLEGDKGKKFMEFIVPINANVSMAIASAKEVIPKKGQLMYIVSGNVHHVLKNVGNRDGCRYFFNVTGQDIPSFNIDDEEMSKILKQVDEWLRKHNPFVRTYESARVLYERELERGDVPIITIEFFDPWASNRNDKDAQDNGVGEAQDSGVSEAQGSSVGEVQDRGRGKNRGRGRNLGRGRDRGRGRGTSRRRDITNVAEVGAVFSSRDGQPPRTNNVYATLCQDPRRRRPISSTSGLADPLCYPMLFPRGTYGWNPSIPAMYGRRVSRREHFVYHAMERTGHFNPITSFGRLSQMYFVDKMIAIDNDRLNYLKVTFQNSSSIAGLMDHVAGGETEGGSDDESNEQNVRRNTVGSRVAIPHTFTGGPRHLKACYYDAMQIVAAFGKPSLMITLTCNPSWPEITENIPLPNLSTYDRADIGVRVFRLKVEHLLDLINKEKIIGDMAAYVYNTEFQKRGLPHVHMLATLSKDDDLRTPEDIDSVVRGELVDPAVNPILAYAISLFHIHEPCGPDNPNAECMRDGKCSRGFPRKFCNRTWIDSKGRVHYKCPNNGLTVISRGGRVADNRWVIPYNPYLLLRFWCHLHVDVTYSAQSVKYAHKYIHKCDESAQFRMKRSDVGDEIEAWQNSRYLSTSESAYRIFAFPLHGMSHKVERLPIHLPGQKRVLFEEGQEQEALQRAQNAKSKLEAFFELNRVDPKAREFTYLEIPNHYLFKNNKWHRRQRKPSKSILSRMFVISPRNHALFHLQRLLLHAKGPTSFDDLLTVDGTMYPSFASAASARNLTRSDDEWIRALQSVARTDMPAQIRRFFAYMLLNCEINNANALLDVVRVPMCHDFVRKGMSPQQAYAAAYFSVETILMRHGSSLERFGIDANQTPDDIDMLAVAYAVDEKDESDSGMRSEDEIARILATFNAEQCVVFEDITNAVECINQRRDRYVFLSGSAGTGKTYFYNALIDWARFHGYQHLAVAFTGIAALLLRGGRTAHSTFKIPLDTDEYSTSSITYESPQAQYLRSVRLLIWDEIVMVDYQIIDVVDRVLRYGRNSEEPFGGVCVVFGGDLKQLLPVKEDRLQTEGAIFVKCAAWNRFRTVRFTKNMRTDAEEVNFAHYLDAVGRGLNNISFTTQERYDIVLPPDMIVQDVVGSIFGGENDLQDENVYTRRAILAPTNNDCSIVNARVLNMLPGDERVWVSVDKVMEEDDLYDPTVVHAATPSGLPPHELVLKIGAPVMLLRNVSLENGLANGTRLIIRAMDEYFLTVSILGRQDRILLPRMDLSAKDDTLGITIMRRQFPIRLCFCMTINKAQGQTFDRVGLYLPMPVFTHGQFYVALSRVRRARDVRIQVEVGPRQGRLNVRTIYTRNVVFENIILLDDI